MVNLILFVVMLNVSVIRTATVPQKTDDEKPVRCADQLPTDDVSQLPKLTRVERKAAEETSNESNSESCFAAYDEEFEANVERIKADSKKFEADMKKLKVDAKKYKAEVDSKKYKANIEKPKSDHEK